MDAQSVLTIEMHGCGVFVKLKEKRYIIYNVLGWVHKVF